MTRPDPAPDRDQQSDAPPGGLVVLARLPIPASDEPHGGCVIAHPEAMIAALHDVAFGPASSADCVAFVARNAALRPCINPDDVIPVLSPRKAAC